MTENSIEQKENNSSVHKDGSENKGKVIDLWQAVLVAIITTIGGGVCSYYIAKAQQHSNPDTIVTKQIPVVVVSEGDTIVKNLPKENNADLYQLKKDVSIFDLRQWHPTPDSLIYKERYSAAGYTNYLHVKKIKELDQIVVHYSTSGFGIDMRCITHHSKFFQREKSSMHDGKLTKLYALVIDISNVPINQEFLIVIEATYWNGFNNLKLEDASTYTDEEIHGLDELALVVFFPEIKPFNNVNRVDRNNKTKVEREYRDLDNYYQDAGKRFIYWSIKQRQANHHYSLKWTW